MESGQELLLSAVKVSMLNNHCDQQIISVLNPSFQ